MLSSELRVWQDVLGTWNGALWIVVALVAANLVAVGFALVAGPRIAAGRWRVAALAPVLVLTGWSFGLLGSLIAVFREQTLQWAQHGPPEAFFRGEALYPGLGQERMITLGLVVLGLAVPGTILAVARVTASASRRALLHGLALTALASAAVVGWLVGDALDLPRRHCLCLVDPVAVHLLRVTHQLDPLVWIGAGAAGLSLLWVLWRRRRTGEALTTSGWQPLAALAVFGLGALAFVTTRGHAHDRHHPVSLTGDPLPESAPPAPAWLAAQACGPVAVTPVVEITPTGARIDGRAVDERELRQDLETMQRNWDVLHPRAPFPGEVSVAVDPKIAWPRLEPWLLALREAGYPRVSFLFDRPRPVQAQTLAGLEVPSACTLQLVLTSPCGWLIDVPHPAERWSTLADTLAEAQNNDIGMVPVGAEGDCADEPLSWLRGTSSR